MQVIRVTNRISMKALAQAAAVLKAGGVVAFPTETAYGLAVAPLHAPNAKAAAVAMARIFAIKGRPDGKALPFVAATEEDVRRRFALSGAAAKLAARHWPGPLTIVLQPRAKYAKSFGKDAAVRVPSSAWARALARVGGGIVTSTSANLSGEPNVYDGAALRRIFAGRADAPDVLLDAGKLPKRAPSTIVRVGKKGIEVLRQGAVRM